MKKPLPWVPLWVDGWLLGSTRDELTVEQRAVFIDFLVLAAKDDGIIRGNKGWPYSPERLAGILKVPVELIIATIDRCIEVEKLRRLPDGSLYISNWDDYKLSRQRRWKLESFPPGPPLEEEKNEKRVEERESRGGDETVNPVDETVNSGPLPPIPTHLELKVKDQLREIRAAYRKALRELQAPTKWTDKDKLAKEAEGLRKGYLSVLEDFKD